MNLGKPTKGSHATDPAVVKIDRPTLLRARDLLVNAGGMLHLEAHEWRSRKNSIPRTWDSGISAWAERCERVGNNNANAAAAMLDIAELLSDAIAVSDAIAECAQ